MTFDLRDTDDQTRAQARTREPGRPTTRAGGSPGDPSPPPRDLLTELQAEQHQRAAAKAQRDAAVEDELAALKRKLGK